MSNSSVLSDYIRVAPRFLRSINLYNDWDNPQCSNGYIVTPNVSQSLSRLIYGLSQENGQRAFALVGPYGSGKSAFAVFLCQLLSRNTEHYLKAFDLIPDDQETLKKEIESVHKKKGFFSITLTARRRPISQLILEGLMRSVAFLKQTREVTDLFVRMQSAMDKRHWRDTATIIEFLSVLSFEVEKQEYQGVLLLVDEAGKTLEYALQDRNGGDVYIFQEIAELASRKRNIPFLFLIALHQMFDDYVELSDRTLRNEWTKVQERFQSIQFAESAATTIKMVSDALEPTKRKPRVVEKQIDSALEILKKNSTPLPLGISFDQFVIYAKKAWPLHPSVLLAIPHLFRRLAQNERSIFSYLTSHEPYGFQESLEKQVEKEDSFVQLHHLYTYLLANFEAGLSRLPHAKRLLEANDILNSRSNLTSIQLELIKTIAILNVLGEICPLRATKGFVESAFSEKAIIDQELENLKQQSLLTFRRLDSSYRVWEGSDVDLEARMKEARRKFKISGSSLLESLSKHLPDNVFVARRHSLETGIHRYFSLQYAETLNQSVIKTIEKNADAAGTVIVVLPQADTAAFEKKVTETTEGKLNIIVAVPRQIDALRGVVEEIACLRWVEENTDELRDDRIARRELSLRLAQCEQRIAQMLQSLLDPRPAPKGNSCQWFWDGKQQYPKRPTDVTKLISLACDAIYPHSPRIRNELVMRKKTSSAASSARRAVLERMLNNSVEERLGIQGFPPEASVYESVLRATEIHACDSLSECWKLQAPPSENGSKLRSCWNVFEDEVFKKDIHRMGLVDLFSILSGAPYGVPDGIHPILFTAFYLVHKDELFLYRENSFIPQVEIAHLELLQRRPDLFSVSGARLSGARELLVSRLAKGFNQPAKTASVVRALFLVLNGLPEVSLKTTKLLDSQSQAIRNVLQNAQSPEEMLFQDLPACLGIAPFKDGEQRSDEMDLFFEKLKQSLIALQEHSSKLRDDCRDKLLSKCGLEGYSEGWEELKARAIWLAPRINHEVLSPFLNCIVRGFDADKGLQSVLSLVASRPFEQWSDMDIDRFPGLADGYGDLFKKTWANYNGESTKLSNTELKQKNKLRKEISQHIEGIATTTSPKALAAALRDILAKIEKDSFEKNGSEHDRA